MNAAPFNRLTGRRYFRLLAVFLGLLPGLAAAQTAVRALAVDLLTEPYELSVNWERHHIEVPREPDVLQAAADTALLRLSRCVVQDRLTELGQELLTAIEADEQRFLIIEIMRLKAVDMQIGKLLGIVLG